MSVRASQIARFLGAELHGADIEVTRPASLDSAFSGCLLFAKTFSEETAQKLDQNQSLALVGRDYAGRLSCPYVVVENPRLAFAKCLGQFFDPRPAPFVAPTAVIAPSAKIGARVSIGHYSVIGEDVVIGDDTEIRNHVVVAARTRIGARCLIKSQAVIGEEGFGFDFEESRPLRIPHVGGVQLGNDVEVGVNTVIVRGTLDDTVLDDRVKLDDQVFVAHNVRIGADTLVVAEAEISGSVRIGAKAWIGPNATLIHKIRIGEGAFVGIGAVVTKDVEPRTTVAGNPARVLRSEPAERT